MAKGPRIKHGEHVITYYPPTTIEDVIFDLEGRTYELMIENQMEYSGVLQLNPNYSKYFVLSNEHLGRNAQGVIGVQANKHVISSALIEHALATAANIEVFWLRDIVSVDGGKVRRQGRWGDVTGRLEKGYRAEVQGEPVPVTG